MKQEINIFFNSLLYYSRFPVPKRVECNNENLNRSIRYFPIVGCIVGCVGVAVLYGVESILPKDIAIILAMIAMMLSTGALHEDGIADFCDGFGGGRDKQHILAIMKDSHIGTYGVISLVFMFLLKFTLLRSIDFNSLMKVIISAQIISRFTPIIITKTLSYARVDNSKSMHSSLGVSWTTIVIALLPIIVALSVFELKFSITAVVGLSLLTLLFRGYINRKIGGFTGDTLGAIEQLSELLFYLLFLVIELKK